MRKNKKEQLIFENFTTRTRHFTTSPLQAAMLIQCAKLHSNHASISNATGTLIVTV